jgi:hypothetical protein
MRLEARRGGRAAAGVLAMVALLFHAAMIVRYTLA